MELKFLGKWSSHITKGERNISFVINDSIVFDFGPHSLEALLDLDVNPAKISTVLISHMHLDHYGGVAELLWYRSINKVDSTLMILGPKGIKENTQNLLKAFNTPENWYERYILKNTEYVEDRGTDFIETFKANHIIQDNGYRLDYNDKTIFYSGDTGYSENVVRGSTDVDLLLHEMTYMDKDREIADFWKHSTYSDVARVYEESKAKRLVPVHLTTETNDLIIEKSRKDKNIIYPKGIITI